MSDLLVSVNIPGQVWAWLMSEFGLEPNATLHDVAIRHKEVKTRAETAERQRDAFESWANTLESCGWHDAGECPYCKANDVRKSTDVLEPDVAKAVCYCGTCRRTWLETPAVRIVTVGSTVVLPADPGLKGKTHTGEGPL